MTAFSVPPGARSLRTSLTLDPAFTPADLRVTVQFSNTTRGASTVNLQTGVTVPVDVGVTENTTVTLAATAVQGVCTTSSIGYGVAIDGEFLG